MVLIQITIHLREDRRHIKDKDLRIISSLKNIPLNLEMACTKEMFKIAIKFKPSLCVLFQKKERNNN